MFNNNEFNEKLNGACAKLIKFAKIPQVMIGFFITLGMVFTAYGFDFKLPKDMIKEQIQYHETQVHPTTISALDSVQHEVEINQENVRVIKQDVSWLVRRQCIETPKEDLQAQGQWQRCLELGVDK